MGEPPFEFLFDTQRRRNIDTFDDFRLARHSLKRLFSAKSRQPFAYCMIGKEGEMLTVWFLEEGSPTN